MADGLRPWRLQNQMDRIEVAGIRCAARIGVPTTERHSPQELRVDVRVQLDLTSPIDHDDFRQTVDYEKLVDLVVEVAESREWSLIETLAAAICEAILSKTATVVAEVRVTKFPRVLEGRISHASAVVSRRR